jgi:hypothetical protein
MKTLLVLVLLATVSSCAVDAGPVSTKEAIASLETPVGEFTVNGVHFEFLGTGIPLDDGTDAYDATLLDPVSWSTFLGLIGGEVPDLGDIVGLAGLSKPKPTVPSGQAFRIVIQTP